VKISTWNVNGVRARELEVWDWLEREQPQILCLQEIKASPGDVPKRLVERPTHWSYWHGHKGYSGVGLALEKTTFPTRPEFFHPDFDAENRIVCAAVEDLVVASVYVPNGNKDYPAKIRFLEALERWIVDRHAEQRRVVVCGDLNVARAERDVHPKLRNPAQIGQSPEERALFERILGHGLADLLRDFHPDDDELFSWWAPWRNMRERNIGWRLDYVLASPPVAQLACACDVQRLFGTSDHGPVTAVFAAPLVDLRGRPVEEPPPPPPTGQLGLF
jgi:exodeoxyribonuclease III